MWTVTSGTVKTTLSLKLCNSTQPTRPPRYAGGYSVRGAMGVAGGRGLEKVVLTLNVLLTLNVHEWVELVWSHLPVVWQSSCWLPMVWYLFHSC